MVWSAARKLASARPRQLGSISKTILTSSRPRALGRRPKSSTEALLWGGLFLVVAACKKEPEGERAPQPTPEIPAAAAQVVITGDAQARFLAERASDCSIVKQGFVFDLSAQEAESRAGYRLSGKGGAVVIRAGRSYRRLEGGESFEFWLPEALTKVGATLLVSHAGSNRVALSIDGTRIGSVAVPEGAPKTLRLRPAPLSLARGRHTLTVSVSKKRGGPSGVEIGWVRLSPDDVVSPSEEPLGASEIEGELTLEEERQRAFILREGMALRCPVWLAEPSTRITTQVAVWGSGDGAFQMILRRDGESARLLAEETFERSEKRTWTAIDSGPLGVAGEFVEIELRAARAGKGSRLAIARPLVNAAVIPETQAPLARRAFVFVLAGLSSLQEPANAAAHGLPVMSELASEAVSYPSYRTNTTSARGVVASIFTGVPPWTHGLIENEDRLDETRPTLAERLSAASGRAAFFTAVPTTFSAFGLGRGFERTEEISPTEDRAADEPLTLFLKWLKKQENQSGPLLGVVHLRGAHPPFDISREAAQLMPPPEYGGEFEPRRAAIQLAQIRARRVRSDRLMPDDDWTRLEALAGAALKDQSRALRETFAQLRRDGLWDDSLIVLMGDVGSGVRPSVPFSEDAPLDSQYLSTPLIIKYPQSVFAGSQVKGLYGPEDVHRTILTLLGQKAAPGATGLVLLPSASPDLLAKSRPHIAYRRGHYSTIMGPYRLSGEEGKEPRLCRRDWDPACSQPREKVDPLAATLLWHLTLNALAARSETKAPGALDPLEERVKNALFVWGAGTD